MIDELTYLLERIYLESKTEVEIEGFANDEGIYLVQLREYDLPKKRNIKLTEIDHKQLLALSSRDSIGFNRFEGDLYVSDEFMDIPAEDIFFYVGDIYEKTIDINEFKKYRKVVIPTYCSRFGYYAMHEYGASVQKMYEIEKLGIECIAIGYDVVYRLRFPEHGGLKGFNRINDNTVVYRNVVVECDGRDMQMFFKNLQE